MIEKLCKEYLQALNEGNLNNVLNLFTSDGVVVSPLYGEMSATQFYTDLFKDTNQSDTMLRNIFTTSMDETSVALHFQYKWTLKNEKIVEFECVDVFEITEDKTQFKKLKIIYDTAPLREDFNKSKN